MRLVCSTKGLTQNLRKNGWDKLLKNVTSFCEKHDIDGPNFGPSYIARQGCPCHQKYHITAEHYLRVEKFFVTIDKQLQKLNCRINDLAMKLLILRSALDPKDAYKAFNIDKICTLVDKYYPMDFNEQEKINLNFQHQHFIIDACYSRGNK